MAQVGTIARTLHTMIEQKPTAEHKAQSLQKEDVYKIAHGVFHNRVTFYFSLSFSFASHLRCI
jgi:hypothetical protein